MQRKTLVRVQQFSIDDVEMFRSFDLWGIYRQQSSILAVRIGGPFTVQVPGSTIEICTDGYLALNRYGRPFVIATEALEQNFELTGHIAGIALFADKTENME